MNSSRRRLIMLAVLGVLGTSAATAHAQTIGTFRWQVQPFCNVLTLNVTQHGGVYTLDGFDDLCGAGTRASVAGIAYPNLNGTIGFGLTLVLAPGAPLHIDAAISLPTISGTWRDSAGNSGALVFNPAIAPGSPRPTAVPLFATGLSAGGARVANVGPPASPTDAATKGYVDAADAATSALLGAASLPPSSQFTFQADGGFVARGSLTVGTIPATGFGDRLMWFPAKAALRAGRANGTVWDNVNVGQYSTAFGSNTTASGSVSVAIGANTVASGFGSVALGVNTTASGDSSVALGNLASTNGFNGAFVYGDDSTNTSTVSATADHQFTVRASGGVRLFTSTDTAIPAPGVQLAPAASAWTTLSDVRSKTHFSDLDGDAVLGKLAAMPIREWSYRAQAPNIRHVGPTAQDFHAAFGLGEDPLGISTVDADGIALRAIQALEARTRRENEVLKRELAALRAELAELKGARGPASAGRR